MQDRFVVHTEQTHGFLTPACVEFRFHRGETGREQDRLFVPPDVSGNCPITPVIILRIPSVVAVFVQEGFALRAPVSLPCDLAAAIEDIDYAMNSRLAFQSRLI